MKPDDIREKLRRLSQEPTLRLREFSGIEELFDDLSPAAVLVPLTERNGEMDLILTKRSAELRKHSGEISFPGGRQDDTDRDLIHTALRESHEEIDLSPTDVEIYGALMQMPTVTGYDVSVFVGEFPHPYELLPNPAEIDTIIQAPLQIFLDGAIHRTEEMDWKGHRFPMHYYDYDGHNVWGATAYMLATLLDYLRGEER